jgi:hypothetical protein
VATLILAALWALWHLPLFFVIANYRAFGVVQYVGFVVGLSCGAIVFTGCTTAAAAASCTWRSGTESLA